MKTVNRKEGRQRRHERIRRKVTGTADRPRLCVMVSNKHIYGQLVDDEKAVTIVSVSSQGKQAVGDKNVAGAAMIGKKLAELAKQAGITAVVFDRGGYRYHGRVKAIADAVREAGFKL